MRVENSDEEFSPINRQSSAQTSQLTLAVTSNQNLEKELSKLGELSNKKITKNKVTETEQKNTIINQIKEGNKFLKYGSREDKKFYKTLVDNFIDRKSKTTKQEMIFGITPEIFKNKEKKVLEDEATPNSLYNNNGSKPLDSISN